MVREARYGCEPLGEKDAMGAGLCYTGLTTSAGFLEAVYATGFTRGPLVDGHPSLVSAVGGGNATLAWEPQPGVVAYIGYSGDGLGDEQIEALRRLAERSTVVSPAEWSTTRPQIVTQTNDL